MANKIDQISYCVLKWAQFNPIPINVKRFAVGFATDSFKAFEIPYVKLFSKNPNSMAQVLQHHREQTRSIYVSQWMRSQPDSIDNIYSALAYFAVPKSFLDRNIGMYLLIKDEEEASLSSMPRTLVGHCSSTEGRDLGIKL